MTNQKQCSKCRNIKPLCEFTKDKSRKDGYCYHCTECRKGINRKVFENKNTHRELAPYKPNTGTFDRKIYSVRYRKYNHARMNSLYAKRRAAKKQATVSWACCDSIAAIYEECQRISLETGIEHHVDHIIPLINEYVCGLHVEFNLQIIPKEQNLSKSNKFVP
jgi:hypothetical protein